jgi:hypothetical protein
MMRHRRVGEAHCACVSGRLIQMRRLYVRTPIARHCSLRDNGSIVSNESLGSQSSNSLAAKYRNRRGVWRDQFFEGDRTVVG